MVTAAIPSSLGPRRSSGILIAALFSYFARRGRHRLAVSAAVILTLIEAVQILAGAADAPGILATLGSLTWCAAWSVSGALREPRVPRAVLTLATQHGLPAERAESLIPVARALLAWTVYGVPSVVLGLCLLAQSFGVQSFGTALVTLAGLALLGLLFALALSALCSLSLALNATRPGYVLWSILIVPALLYPALPELPSLTHLTLDFTGLLFQALTPRGIGL